MAALEWDKVGERLYQTGDKQVALYPYSTSATSPTGSLGATNYPLGVAWNGITAITETPGGADATDLWADDDKYATMRAIETFSGTIEAYMYPDEWEQCDGSATVNGVTLGQQSRRAFGLAYITTVGNDTELNDYGEKLHLVYGCTASPASRSYSTINESPEAITFSWEYQTNPVAVGEVNGVTYKKVSCVTIDNTRLVSKDATSEQKEAAKEKYENFKKIIYGSATNTPCLPTPAQVLGYFANQNIVFEYVLAEGSGSTAPDDWATNFFDYYTRSGTGTNEDPYVYTKVPVAATAPTFTTGKYYKRQLDTD